MQLWDRWLLHVCVCVSLTWPGRWSPSPLLCRGSAVHGFLPELCCAPRAEPAARAAAAPAAASTERALQKRAPVPGGPSTVPRRDRGLRLRSPGRRCRRGTARGAVRPSLRGSRAPAAGTPHSPVAEQSQGQLCPQLTSNTGSGGYST